MNFAFSQPANPPTKGILCVLQQFEYEMRPVIVQICGQFPDFCAPFVP